LCFLRSAPAEFIEGFSCLRTSSKPGFELICFRSADPDDIDAYKSNYIELYSKKVKEYLNSSSKCHASNGNTTLIGPSTFPSILTIISKYELGFISPLGEGRAPRSIIQHGYATTDPQITGDIPSALEYVYMLVDGNIYKPEEKKQLVGDLAIYASRDIDLDNEINNKMQKLNIPFKVNAMSYRIEGGGTTDQSNSEKNKFIHNIKASITSDLEDEGFEDIPEDVFEENTGKSYEEVVKEINGSIPFGAKQYKPLVVSENLHFMINQRRPSCTEEHKGAIAIYLSSLEPNPAVKSDYGSINIMVAGLGSCSRISRKSTQTFISGLLEVTTESLKSSIKKRDKRSH
jgi:hypothetical protein